MGAGLDGRARVPSDLWSLFAKHQAPVSAKPLIASLLQKAKQDPYAYESKSGGVVELLEDLKTRFLDELHKLEVEEMETAHAYDMEALTLTDSIKYAEKERATKATSLAENEAAAGEAKGSLAQVQKARLASPHITQPLGHPRGFCRFCRKQDQAVDSWRQCHQYL